MSYNELGVRWGGYSSLLQAVCNFRHGDSEMGGFGGEESQITCSGLTRAGCASFRLGCSVGMLSTVTSVGGCSCSGKLLSSILSDSILEGRERL